MLAQELIVYLWLFPVTLFFILPALIASTVWLARELRIAAIQLSEKVERKAGNEERSMDQSVYVPAQ